MKKREFLDLLRYYLRSYPYNMLNDIISDYEEHFQAGIENGKTEEQICAELGSPKDISDEFLNSHIPPKPDYGTNTCHSSVPPKKKLSLPILILIIIGVIICAPLLLGIITTTLVSVSAIIVSLFGIILAFGFSGIVSIIAAFVPIEGFGINGYIPCAPTSVFLGIFLISLAALLGCITFLLMRICAKGIKSLYLSIRWNLLKRRNIK